MSDIQHNVQQSMVAETVAVDQEKLHAEIIRALKSCYDPEIPVDIYELGLIYSVQIDDRANVIILMTLTSPACPVAGSLPLDVETRVNGLEKVNSVSVEITWDPPWNPEMMSAAAKLDLGF